MEIIEVAKDIYKIPIFLPNSPLKILNSYYIKGKERGLLIDAGFRNENCHSQLVEALNELGVDPDGFDVFCTHMHSDHAGGASEIVGPSGKVFMYEIDMFKYMDEKGQEFMINGLMHQRKVQGITDDINEIFAQNEPAANAAARVGCACYTPIKADWKISVGDYNFELVLTPGHTTGHTCLWEPDKKIMFLGDAVLFDITPNIVFFDWDYDSLGSYLDSLNRLQQYPVEIALPGHRESGDYHKRIADLLAHHEARLNEAYEVIKQIPGAVAMEVAMRMKWSIKAKSWEDFPAGQKVFASGEAHSHLVHLKRLGKLRSEFDELEREHFYPVD